jgi:hypothetical protein
VRLNDSVIDYYDDFYRLRLEALLAVDDLVNAVFEKLKDLKLLDNTYVGNYLPPFGNTSDFDRSFTPPIMDITLANTV